MPLRALKARFGREALLSLYLRRAGNQRIQILSLAAVCFIAVTPYQQNRHKQQTDDTQGTPNNCSRAQA